MNSSPTIEKDISLLRKTVEKLSQNVDKATSQSGTSKRSSAPKVPSSKDPIKQTEKYFKEATKKQSISVKILSKFIGTEFGKTITKIYANVKFQTKNFFSDVASFTGGFFNKYFGKILDDLRPFTDALKSTARFLYTALIAPLSKFTLNKILAIKKDEGKEDTSEELSQIKEEAEKAARQEKRNSKIVKLILKELEKHTRILSKKSFRSFKEQLTEKKEKLIEKKEGGGFWSKILGLLGFRLIGKFLMTSVGSLFKNIFLYLIGGGILATGLKSITTFVLSKFKILFGMLMGLFAGGGFGGGAMDGDILTDTPDADGTRKGKGKGTKREGRTPKRQGRFGRHGGRRVGGRLGGALKGGSKLANFLPTGGKILNAGGRVLGATAGAALIGGIDVYSGVSDLMKGRKQETMPTGFGALSPMKWGMFMGEGISKAMGINKGEFGSSLYGLIHGTEKTPSLLERGKSAVSTAYQNVKGVVGNVLGSVSAFFESGGKSNVISSGKGDAGGKSYGKHQLSSKSKTLGKFLKQSGYAQQFSGMAEGSAQFDQKWRQLTQSDPNFTAAQSTFIKKTHYDPMVAGLRKKGGGFDLSKRGKAVQEMLYSTAVQFGGGERGVNVILKGIKSAGKDPSQMTDAEIISAVQQYKARNVGTLFKSSSKQVQASVGQRALNEEQMLLAVNKNTAPLSRAEAAAAPTLTDNGSTGIRQSETTLALEKKRGSIRQKAGPSRDTPTNISAPVVVAAGGSGGKSSPKEMSSNPFGGSFAGWNLAISGAV